MNTRATDWPEVLKVAVYGGIAYGAYLLLTSLAEKFKQLERTPEQVVGAFRLLTNEPVTALAEVKFPDGRIQNLTELINQGGRTRFVGKDLHITLGGAEWRITGKDAAGRYTLQAIIT